MARPCQSVGRPQDSACHAHHFPRRSYRISKSPEIVVPVFGGHTVSSRYVWLFRLTLFICITTGHHTLLFQSSHPFPASPYMGNLEVLTKRTQIGGDQVTQNLKQYWACESATLSIACVGAEFTIKAINSLADERASYFSVLYTTLAHAGRPSIVLERSDDHSGCSCRPQCRSCAEETVDTPSRTHQRLIYGPYHDFSQLPSSSGRGAPSA